MSDCVRPGCLVDGDGWRAMSISIRERVRIVVTLALDQGRSQLDQVSAVPDALDLLTGAVLDIPDIGSLFALSPRAEATLCLALGPDLDPELSLLFAELARDLDARRPSLALALALVGSTGFIDLTVLDELTGRGLLHARPRNVEPIAGAPLVPSPALVARLLGSASRPPWATLVSDTAGIQVDLPDLPDTMGEHGTLIHLHGSNPAVLRDAAVLVAARLGRAALFVTGLATDPERIGDANREARIERAVVVVDDADLVADDSAPAPNQHESNVALPVERLGHAVIHLGTSEVPPLAPPGTLVVPIAVPTPGADARTLMWADALPDHLNAAARPLGDRYRLVRHEIAAAVAHAVGLAGSTSLPADDLALLKGGARAQTGDELARLAPRVAVRERWSALVLTQDAREQLEELIARVEHRARVVDDWGYGDRRDAHPVTALMVGPSGTGKSVTAEAIAERTGLALHRIDLSRVVSKYIGETERQLEQIFEAASRTTAILFFDEADALFGQRSEVRDAHDRYANLEVSYLLQRMESYDGVALLATNLAGNLDEAFTRRLDFTIHFPFPDVEARLRLWRGAWPPRTPLADLASLLAKLSEQHELSGGNIHNVAEAAAYLAATEQATCVEERHVVHALRRELQKVGATVPDLVGALE